MYAINIRDAAMKLVVFQENPEKGGPHDQFLAAFVL